MFPKEFEAKTGVTVSSKYQTQLNKYLLLWKSRRSRRRCSVKEGLQRPAQVFSCEYCKIFKNTCSENICERLLPKISTSVTNFWREVIPEFYYPFKAFSILNFAMTEYFFFSQTYFYHKKVHIKWDVVISSSLRLLIKVCICYRCQNRTKYYYHHDGNN